MAKDKVRILLTGVGGQGTLTATKILAEAALDKGLHVTAGEIHGMAQRGGVVESAVLIGGYLSPKLGHGEADVLLGFEPLETLRALPYLASGGVVVSSSEPILPIGVSLGRERYPELADIETKTRQCATSAHFLPCLSLGRQAGTTQSANMVLLGALCALGLAPLSLEDLKTTMARRLKARFLEINNKAVELGAAAVKPA
ncbi:indolepyruvate ferredoxin oxidoreductase, subunit iorB [Desulfocurvibacter africanus PCS]|uniref:Indolepyruvate ferredoxin oxidoreductase, subunit iorB n=1 Tax=Desulfocurvibacter africanus PCS TaxID=1262666 RepID=M5Q324_DESAF|nr:indolepyruvate oxidoreductase subunit beta [Desulfocurvibacter africanus]EMG37908.1 indolepyruvate ferredoxin oxidoreductase, subunit iorB [Desulfocurvibacter africanus PCS]